MRFLSLLLRRVLAVLVVMVGAATIVFGVLRLSGDPVLLFAAPDTPPEVLAQIRHDMGFDAPIYVQYALYLRNLATGDLGVSIRYDQPVTALIIDRLPTTLQLTFAGLLIAVVFGVLAGVIAAVSRGSIYDQLSVVLSLLGQAVPPFWLGLMLILVFAVHWRLFPTFGTGDLRHLVLPAITVGAFSTARIARLTRAAFLDVLSEDYLRTARGKGLRETAVFIRHAAPNAAIPIVTVISVTLSTLVGGAIITETVFALPGLGQLMVQGVLVRDYPLVQGSVLVVAIIVTLISLATDTIYMALDPRIRFGGRER
ncbi:ABC transporter permease [Petrachloros mirabilis]